MPKLVKQAKPAPTEVKSAVEPEEAQNSDVGDVEDPTKYKGSDRKKLISYQQERARRTRVERGKTASSSSVSFQDSADESF